MGIMIIIGNIGARPLLVLGITLEPNIYYNYEYYWQYWSQTFIGIRNNISGIDFDL